MLIARQPIFDKALNVYGYELLYRSSSNSNEYDGTSSYKSTLAVAGSLFEEGLEKVADNRKVFINFDEEGLYSDVFEILSPKHLIIEVLEDVCPSDPLIERLELLREKGYTIALDDFERDMSVCSIAALSDIIKFDVLNSSSDMIEEQSRLALGRGKTILAEKVETEEDFNSAVEKGFTLFQGYFFSRPKSVEKSCKKYTTQNQYMRILSELEKEEPCYQKLAEIIEKDPAMSYRLLRVVGTNQENSEIYSIKKALTYMGMKELKHWINILLIQELGAHTPKELLKLALSRSKFAELIARRTVLKTLKFEASLMGLFSVIDAILEMNMYEALEYIPLSETVKEALIYERGVLAPLQEMILAYENGDYESVDVYIEKYDLTEVKILEDYFRSIEWADAISLLL